MTKLTTYNPQRNPFSIFDIFEREFNHPYAWGDVQKTGDTVRFKEGDELTVEVDLPGVSKDKTQVTVDGRVVSIEGSRKVVSKGGTQEETYSRSFTVNSIYNIDKCKAVQLDGVLTLTFPKNKVDPGNKRTIEIS